MKLVDSNRRPLDPKFDVVPLSHRAPRIKRINVFGSLCLKRKMEPHTTTTVLISQNHYF